MKDCYKNKLRRAGYRLVYQVRDHDVVVSVVAVGKRKKIRFIIQLSNEFRICLRWSEPSLDVLYKTVNIFLLITVG